MFVIGDVCHDKTADHEKNVGAALPEIFKRFNRVQPGGRQPVALFICAHELLGMEYYDDQGC
jgi:hypothetical protein